MSVLSLWCVPPLLLCSTASAQLPAASDPLGLFQPSVRVSAEERARLERGETVVKSVSPVDGQVAIFSAARVQVTGDRLVRWVRRVEAMKRGRYATDVVRFSDPPRLEDLASLRLDRDDLDELRRCRIGSCGLKLSEHEISTLAPLARTRKPGWQAEVQQAFRMALLARTEAYLAGGLTRVPPYRDRDVPVRLDEEFGSLLSHSGFLPARLPALTQYLLHYPASPTPAVESFLYWSKEVLGRKPVISITHVTIARSEEEPDAAVVSRQIYASHYMSGSIAVTAIVGGGAGPRFLMYLNRSRVDVLDGFLGGLVRRIVERRLRDEAGQVVDGLRRRIEAGDPPLPRD